MKMARGSTDAVVGEFLSDHAHEFALTTSTGWQRLKIAFWLLHLVVLLQYDWKIFFTVVTGVLCVRLIRKLCDACKIGYAPTPDLLKKLGIPAGTIEALYRSPKPDEIEKPCKECGGLGFKGRTAIFELLEVDDKMREVLLKKPQLDLARKVARAAGMRPFQEEGLLLVAKGLTSLAELQRVLKE